MGGDSMLREGDKAPSFSLPDENGKMVSLKDFKGKTVVLYFYPKDMTPGCTQEACDFRDSHAQWKKAKAIVIGVSKDSAQRHLKFKEKYDLNFPLLADEEGQVCKDYGVWKEKSLYGRKFMGIERTTFIIGPTGKIEKIFSKVKVKGHAEAVINEI
jgi:thioredoxin-dependent peroxiredoxin